MKIDNFSAKIFKYIQKEVIALKKAAALLLAVIMAAMMLTSCHKESPVVLFYSLTSPAGTFDPQIVSDKTASVIVRNCFEGLMRRDAGGNPVDAAAETHSISADGLTYTFNLRKDAKWHLTSNAKDQAGEKLPENFDLSVTAYDFAFALKRAVDPATGSGDAYMFYNIAGAPEIMKGAAGPETLGVKATDKYTLEINLTRPQSNFLEVLCSPAAMPCNETFFNTCSGRYGTLIKFSLSNGPFYLSRFDDKSYRINRSPEYCGTFTAVPDAVWLYVEDNKKIIEELQEDEISAAALSQESYSKLETNKNMNIREESNIIRGFLMNMQDPVLANENIRKAISAATDTAKVAENGGRTPLKGIVPSSAAPANITEHPDLYNEEKAVEYFKNGLAELEQTKAEISVICEPEYEDTIKRLLQEWQRILGINAIFTVKVSPADDIKSAVRNGNYQIAFSSVTAHTDSAYEYFGSFASNSFNSKTGFRSEGLVKLIAELGSGNEAKFAEKYKAIENELVSASFMIPVWEEKSYFVTTKNVGGIKYFSGEDKIYFESATNIK